MKRLRAVAVCLCLLCGLGGSGCREKSPPPDTKQQIDMPPPEQSPNAINPA